MYSDMFDEGRSTAGVTGHAHPQSAAATHNVHEIDETLIQLISEVPLNIVLRKSSSGAASCGPMMPHVRRSPITTEPVQHLNIVSCWKGLSHQQTLELEKWEQVFQKEIASQIKHDIRRRLVERLSKEHSDPTNESLLVSRMIESVKPNQPTETVLSITELAHQMISRLYSRWPTETIGRHLSWSLSSGNLPVFVFNFVGTHDCILYEPEDPTTARISYTISPSYSEGVLDISVELKWHLAKTSFPGLPSRLSYGEMYHIAPQFNNACLGGGSQGLSRYTHTVTYSVMSSTLPLQWDFQNGCFQAPAVYGPQVEYSSTVQTMICTKISTPFPRGVRFERVSRHNIKLEVVDAAESSQRHPREISVYSASWDEEDMAHLLNYPLGTSPMSDSDNDVYTNTSYVGETPRASHERPHVDRHTRDGTYDTLHWHPIHHAPTSPSLIHLTNEAHPPSPSKRKASSLITNVLTDSSRFVLDKLEHSDLDAKGKRRKLEQDRNTDVSFMWDAPVTPTEMASVADNILYAHLNSILTGPTNQGNTSPALGHTTWFEKFDSPTVQTSPKSNAAILAGNKPPGFGWQVRTGTSPSARSDTPPLPDKVELKPLTQDEIQRNYREFEQRRKQKEAEKAFYAATVPMFDGVISPTEEGDRAFERVFLENSEEGGWASDAADVDDGLSDGMDSLFCDGDDEEGEC